MKKISLSLIVIVLVLSSGLFARADKKLAVTKFNNIAPVTIFKDSYSRSNIMGLKNYKVPLYNDLRYSVFTSLMGVTRIIFPDNMRIVAHKSGMEEYFEVTPQNGDLKAEGNSYRYLFIRPIIPASTPEAMSMKIQKDKNLLNSTSTQLHVTLKDDLGNDIFMIFSLEISSKKNENETIEITKLTHKLSEIENLQKEISELNNTIYEGMKREESLHFNDFRLAQINETKTYNSSTTVELHTITATKGYYYYHVTLKGTDLFPLRKEDIKLEINYFTKGMFWEDKEGWIIDDVESILVYPDHEEETLPAQNLDFKPQETFKKNITFRFKSKKEDDFFYSKLNIKNGSVYFEKKVSLKKSTEDLEPFLNEQIIWP